MSEVIGNEQQMAEVRKAMELKKQADEVNQGKEARDVVEVDFTSEESGIRYAGKFVFKRPSIMDTMRMGGRKTQILKEAGVIDTDLADDGIMAMAGAIATLEVVIVKAPEWFLNVQDVQETDLLMHVYGKYSLWEYSFRLANNPEFAGDSKTSK